MENISAPLFTTTDHFGNSISLESLRGKKVLLYFYPKDMTSGCTTEALGFQDVYQEFKKHNTEICAVSLDSQASHKKFCDTYNLTFPLLMDTDAEIASDYNVYDEVSKSINRESFLINEQGIIIKHWKNVQPVSHPQDVLDYLQSL